MKIVNPLRFPVFGGLSDQVVVSASNFALNVYLVRCISATEYGAFSFVLSVMVFLNSTHQAFVVYPLSVYGASASNREFDRLLAGAVSATAIVAVVLVPLLAGATASVGLIGLVIPASIAMIAWQLQEVCRRGFLARSRFAAAIGSDSFRYVGVLACVVGLSTIASLSLSAIFAIIACGSAIGSGALITKFVRVAAVRPRKILEGYSDRLRLTGPVIAANVLAAFSNQWFLWMLTWTHGFHSSGALVALANIAAVASPVIFGVENIILPEISRERQNRSYADLASLLLRRIAAGGLLIGPFLAGIAIWPGDAARLVYGRVSEYAQFAPCLRLLALSYGAFLCSTALSAALRAYCASRAVLMVQLWPALLGATAGSILIGLYGIEGACLATCVAASLRVLIALYFVMELRELTPRATATMLNSTGGPEGAVEIVRCDELSGAR
jgi:O-antigen/teichoic acid export membrane protein